MDITAMALKILKSGKRRRYFFRTFCHSVPLSSVKNIVRKSENTTPSSWKVMFFGTDDFSLGSLSRLTDEMRTTKTVSKLEVVSSKWHLNPVRLFGQKEGLVIHEWPINPHVISDFDIGVVASFGHLIPKQVIDSFPLGLLNVHGSLLPRWRGASPVNYAIMHGDEITGISIMRIQPYEFDLGEVVTKREVQIHPMETAPQLRQRLSEIGGEEIISCIRKLPMCLMNAKPQPHDGVTYAPKITSDLGVIEFDKMSAKCIYNKFRALYGIVPLMISWMGLRLSLHDVSALDDNLDTELQGLIGITSSLQIKDSSQSASVIPGQVLYSRKGKYLIIRCSENSFLIVRRIAPHRKRPLSAVEFYNGYLSKQQDKALWLFN